jgi:hypothetical protein
VSSGGEDPNKTMLGVSPFAPDNDPNGRPSVRPEAHAVPGQQSVEARLAEKRRDLQLKTRPMQAIADLDWDLPEGTTSGASPVVPAAAEVAPSPIPAGSPSFEPDAFARLPGVPAPSGAVPPIDAAARTLVMTNDAMQAALHPPTPAASPAVVPQAAAPAPAPARSGTLMMSASDMAKFAAEQHAQIPGAFADATPAMPAPFAAATPAHHAPAPVEAFAPPPVAAPAPFVSGSGPLPTTAAEAGRPYAGGTMVMSAFDNPAAQAAPAAAAALGAAAHAQTGSSVAEGRLEMPNLGVAPHVSRGVPHPSHGQSAYAPAEIGSLGASGARAAHGAPPAVPFTPSSAPVASPASSGPPKALLLVGAVIGAVIVIAILLTIF